MRKETGTLWDWDDGEVMARVIPVHADAINSTAGKEALRRFGDGLKAKLTEYFDRWGDHVHAFPPNPEADRDYWLVTFPTDDVRRSAQELLAWVISISEIGTVVLPDPESRKIMADLAEVFDQQLLFSSGYVTSGDRFVVVKP